MKHNKRRNGFGFVAATVVMAGVLSGCGGQTDSAEQQQDSSEVKKQETQQQESQRERENKTQTPRSYVIEKAETESEEEADKPDQEDAAPKEAVTFSIVGDSISTYLWDIPEGYYPFYPENGAVKDRQDTWWQMFMDDTGSVLYTNASSSGSTCTGDSTSMDDPQCSCDELRVSDLNGPEGLIPDAILIYMGTNDLLKSIPLGTNDGTVPVTEGNIQNFSDAYTLMLDKLEREYPVSEIYCCTLTQIATWSDGGVLTEFVNGVGEGLTAADYSACIEKIAKNRGLSVVDLYGCGIGEENWSEVTTDGVHPTPEGMRYIAKAVEQGLGFEGSTN